MRLKHVAAVVLLLILWGAMASGDALEPFDLESFIGSGDNFFSISAIPYDPDPAHLFGAIDLGTEPVYRWDAGTTSQVGYDIWSPEVFGNITPGDGYLMAGATQGYSVSFDGFPFPADTDAWIPLGSEGTWIGNPLGSAVDWDHVCATNGQVIYPLEDEDSDDLLITNFFGWDNPTYSQFMAGPARQYAYSDQMLPWQGYAATAVDGTVALIIPHDGALPNVSTDNSIGAAKLLEEEEYASLTGYITYVGNGFAYLEQANRIAGIRVECWELSLCSVGDLISVSSGQALVSSDGEKYISVEGIGGESGTAVTPLGMCNRTVGGGDWNYNSGTGAGQQGVAGGWGLNNVGLLVRAWGKFTPGDDPSWFTIDDGTGNPLKCVLPDGLALSGDAEAWKYVNVTGVVSCYRDSADNVRPEILVSNDVPDSQIMHRETPTYTGQVTIGSSTSKTLNPLLSGYVITYDTGNNVLADRTVVSGIVKTDSHVTDSFKTYVQALKPGLIRYLGGDDYHWRWAVGPMEKRPCLRTWNIPWRVPLFGTDELMIFCNDVDSENPPEPIMVANCLQSNTSTSEKGLGTILWRDKMQLDATEILNASMQEAANWVEYCNGDVTDTDTTRTCSAHEEMTHTVLEWAAEENWVPSILVDPVDQYSSNPTEITNQSYDVVEWAGAKAWLSYATRNAEPSPALNPAPPSGYYQAPVGYFSWLRRYFAWQRAGSPLDQEDEPTWKNLSLFTEASYNAPYNVKYWEMGNEVYWNHPASTVPDCTTLTGETYAQMLGAYSDLMKPRSTTTIKIGASVVGHRNYAAAQDYQDWDNGVVSECDTSKIDFLAPHYYSSPESQVMELHQTRDESERTLVLAQPGDYQFKVIGRGSLDNRSLLPEQNDPARFELRLLLDNTTIDVGEAKLLGPQLSEPITPQNHPDLFVTLHVDEADTYVLRMTNLQLDHLNVSYTIFSLIYKVYMKRPASSRWEPILFPEDTEQQLLENDYHRISRELVNPDKTTPETMAGYWGLKDRLAAEEKDLDVLVTEGNLLYQDIYTGDGYPSRQVNHAFRYKAAFWFPSILKALNDNDILGYTMHNLVDSGYWGLIRNPRGYAGHALATEANVDVSIVTPSYYFMTLWAQMLGGALYDVDLGSTPTFDFSSSLPSPARFNDWGDATWEEWFCMKPQNVPYLDATVSVKSGENKLYMLVINRKNEYASTTIDTGSFSVASTASVSTLHVRTPLINDTQAFASWNVDPMLDAHCETAVADATTEVSPDDIGIDTDTITNASSSFVYTFEPYSFTLFEFITN